MATESTEGFAAPRISVSSPAESETVSGLITVSGWAHAFFKMPKLTFSLNGQSITPESVSTGLYAPQVCGGSPGIWHPECNRYSGFSAKLETRRFPNGVHKLEIGATNSYGFPSLFERTLVVSNSCFDFTSPAVKLTYPVSPYKVTGVFNVTANASDDSAVTGVEFLVDGVSKGIDTTAPYSFRWDTNAYSVGSHLITAVARDGCSNEVVDKLFVTVERDTLAPVVSLVSPASGSWVRGTVAVQAQGSDNVEVTRVEFLVDNVLKATDTVPPFTYNWTPSGDGAHDLVARAYDSGGNVGLSPAVTVRVDNTPPLLSVAAPTYNQTVYGTATRVAGWATDASGSVSLSFSINGQDLPLNGGGITWLSRPDVCSAYPVADGRCPYVGWRGFFDTTRFPNGWYTLDVKVVDAVGLSASERVNFYINNPVSSLLARFGPTDDAWVRQTYPTTNFGKDPNLGVRYPPTTGDGQYSFLKFNVTGLSGTVTSAKLLLRTRTPLIELFIYRVDSTWSEGMVTWTNMPSGSAVEVARKYSLSGNNWHDFDVTSYVTGNGVYAFGYASADTGVGLGCYSRETAYPPVLEVTYRP